MLWLTIVFILILSIVLFGLLFKRQRLLNDIKFEILKVNERSDIGVTFNAKSKVSTKRVKNTYNKDISRQEFDTFLQYRKNKAQIFALELEQKSDELFEKESALTEEMIRKGLEENVQYAQIAKDICVDGVGYDWDLCEEQSEKFLSFIISNKIIDLADVSAKFNLTPEVVSIRIKRILTIGDIDGIFDERGRFIAINREELENLAAYLTKKGRINILDIAHKSETFVKFVK